MNLIDRDLQIYRPFVKLFERIQQEASTINRASFGEAETLAATLGPPYEPLVERFHNAEVGLKLALVMSELGEALEAVRRNKGADEHLPGLLNEEVEIADAIIRLMNYGTDRGLRLAQAIVEKIEYNRTRKDHLPENRAADHGKNF